MNLDVFIDRVGDWNPQLFRELKGKLMGNTVTFTLIASICLQVIFGLWLVERDSSMRMLSGFQFLSWVMPIGSILGGIYSVISDFRQEAKRETLNFIKLSPQSGRSIFLGKILGVPSLVYLAVLSLVPLHIFLALFVGTGLGGILAWYVTICVTTYLFLSITVLYVLYGGKYAIIFTLLALQPISGAIATYNFYLSSVLVPDREAPVFISSSWFYLPIVRNIWLFYGFTCGTYLIISYWIWQAIERKYVNPQATVFKKEHSYWMNINLQIWLLGFALPLMTGAIERNSSEIPLYLLTFYTISTVWVVWLMTLTLPTSQAMQDWIGYSGEYIDRSVGVASGLRNRQWWQSQTMQDLIWHDRSPSIVAVGINLAISALVWELCALIFIRNDLGTSIKFSIGVAIATVLSLIYSVIIHIINLRSQMKTSGAMPLLIVISICPLFLGALLRTNIMAGHLGSIVLLFSPFFWVGITQLSLHTTCVTLLGQLGMLAGLTKLFQRRLQSIGLANARSLAARESKLARTNI